MIGTVLLSCVSIWLVSTSAAEEEGVYKCSPDKIKNGDPIAGAIAHLAQDLLNSGPTLKTDPGKIFCYENTYEGEKSFATAYGSASCQFHDSPNCAACLEDALQGLSVSCPDRVGAQITLTDCFMRFENYRYCD
ncbi:unnamed protein product [Linum trigynum]|uniref:Gnk2-homologous domain-containing protein n=1 Tax=Linum trigynum TaxID=586398 RepID=A0AAV2EGZ4_9ROSI